MRLRTFIWIMCMIILSLPSVVLANESPSTGEAEIDPGLDGPRIVASTSWTAAIAQAAGAREVDILAPFELRHPPERDFRPSDITRTNSADYIVWAGYEGFMQQLVDAADIPLSRSIRITTQNDPDHLVALTRQLASTWGTSELQAVWEKDFLAKTDRIFAAARAQNAADIKVVAVGHMVPFLTWLGYDIVGTFGFEEMTPTRLLTLSQLKPDMVVDVWHNPTAEPLAKVAGARYAALLNFPGHNGTRSLLDVFEYNAKMLGLVPSTPPILSVHLDACHNLPGTTEIVVPAIGLGERLIEVIHRIVGTKTVRVENDAYVLQVPGCYEDEYRDLFAVLTNANPTAAPAETLSNETWVIQFAQNTSPLLIDIFHLVFGTEVVKHIEALNVVAVQMPAGVDGRRYVYVLRHSPLVVSIEPNQHVTIF